MAVANFEITRLPQVIFGSGAISRVPLLAKDYGSRALLVTGAKSFIDSTHYATWSRAMRQVKLQWETYIIDTEPSPQKVDEAATRFRQQNIDVVIGIGGGSVLDAAKAIAGLLQVSHSVMDFLEGVGPELPYPGPTVPFIAVPTTAGTGSEATKNAVLSVSGLNGFKKSFRHPQLIAQHAILDPDLLTTCPKLQIAANGMDALTQLLESYVSTKANPFTDALAISGISMVSNSLFDFYHHSQRVAEARSEMLYAAWLSGITLAQVGLGAVHGLAAPLGAFFSIPHGVACGSMVAVCTEINLNALKQRAENTDKLEKYAHVGKILAKDISLDQDSGLKILLEKLTQWTKQLDLPRLSAYGMTQDDIPHVVANSRGNSMKTNPIVLTDDEIATALKHRL